jgi:predicted RNase H-like HicB family nuclease
VDADMKLRLTEEIWKEGNMFVSYCPELDVSSCGENVEQAKRNLTEAIRILIEETRKMGTFEKLMEECGFEEQRETLTVRRELVGFSPIEVSLP